MHQLKKIKNENGTYKHKIRISVFCLSILRVPKGSKDKNLEFADILSQKTLTIIAELKLRRSEIIIET